ncbi:hypothetical protein BC835DRAFT_1311011 [Cytidiella melzeri]|nr:hypothetical protein BC835DRAFT_1311011 [Cytidiella melzeri]
MVELRSRSITTKKAVAEPAVAVKPTPVAKPGPNRRHTDRTMNMSPVHASMRAAGPSPLHKEDNVLSLPQQAREDSRFDSLTVSGQDSATRTNAGPSATERVDNPDKTVGLDMGISPLPKTQAQTAQFRPLTAAEVLQRSDDQSQALYHRLSDGFGATLGALNLAGEDPLKAWLFNILSANPSLLGSIISSDSSNSGGPSTEVANSDSDVMSEWFDFEAYERDAS